MKLKERQVKLKRLGHRTKAGDTTQFGPASASGSAIPADIARELQVLLDAQREQILAAFRSELRSRPALSSTDRRFYTVEEAAKLLGKSEYTVRELCRHGRLNATKRAERRGGAKLWSISAEEIARYQDEGLLPIDRPTR